MGENWKRKTRHRRKETAFLENRVILRRERGHGGKTRKKIRRSLVPSANRFYLEIYCVGTLYSTT